MELKKIQMEKIVISCLESRVETNRSVYARFLLGPFQDDNAITIGTALRRSLLSKVKSVAITAIQIQGVTHEFSTIVGVRESVLDLALNFQQVILRTRVEKQKKRIVIGNDQSDSSTVKIGYLQMEGPVVVYANDLQLPAGIECVDPTQYIATLSTEGFLVVKFTIGTKKACSGTQNSAFLGKQISVEPESSNLYTKSRFEKSRIAEESVQNRNPYQTRAVLNTVSSGSKKERPDSSQKVYRLQEKNHIVESPDLFQLKERTAQRHSHSPFQLFDPTICLRNTIFLDPIFSSVLQANYVIERDDLFNQARERIVLEFWTNGSVHPRQALHRASLSLLSTFSLFQKVFHLDSL